MLTLRPTQKLYNVLKSLITAPSLPLELREQIEKFLETTPQTGDGTPLPSQVPSDLLVKVSRWARSNRDELAKAGGLDAEDLRLANLLKWTEVYYEELKPRERSPELESILSRIRLEQEKAEYLRLISQSSPSSSSSFVPPVYANQSLEGKYRSPAQEWKEANRELSAVVNVLVSMVAVGVAVWWVGGNNPPEQKILLSLFGAFVIGGAESFLYFRFFQARDQGVLAKAKAQTGKRIKLPQDPSTILSPGLPSSVDATDGKGQKGTVVGDTKGDSSPGGARRRK